MRKIIPARSNSKLATHFCSIVLAATALLVIAADAHGSAPAASTNNSLTATDIHGARHSCPVNKLPGWLADAVARADVESEWGRDHHEHGTGVFRMSVDPKTGKVTHVSTVKSAGFRDLDDAVIATLGRWRWKPGTWKEADVALSFQSGKASVGAAQTGLPNYQRPNTSHQGMNMRSGGRY